MKRIECTAIVVLAALSLAAIACGQPLTTAEETQTAQAVVSPVPSATVAVISTTPDATAIVATATAQPTPPSPPQILAIATPAFITPIATGASQARADCPADWLTYANPSGTISVCAPTDAVAVGSVSADGEPGLNIATDLGGVFSKTLPQFAVTARLSASAMVPPSNDLSAYCAGAESGGTATTISTAYGDVAGCDTTVELNAQNGPLRTVRLTVQLTAPAFGLAFLNMDINWRVQSEGAEALAKDIALSLRVAP